MVKVIVIADIFQAKAVDNVEEGTCSLALRKDPNPILIALRNQKTNI